MANKKTITIHIGTPKTGTTSIQEYLERNEEALYKAGCLVPKTSRRVKPNHTLLANYCININRITEISIRNRIHTVKALKKFRRNFPKELRTEIKQFHGDNVVFSSEQCYGRLTTAKELKKLKALFRGLDYQIKIIVYIREQTDMLCSLYSSEMKQGKTYPINGVSEFKKRAMYDYNGKLKIWEEVFGIQNIVLRIFDKEHLFEKDIISDFCHTIQIPRYKNEAIYRNTSLNAKQCEYLRIANPYIPLLYNGKVNEKRVGLVEMIANTNIDSPGVSSWISKAYQEVYKESNQALAKRYFGEPSPLFQKKPLNEKAQNQTTVLTQEDKEAITRQIIQKNKEQNEMLCKCLAAIFEMKYESQTIPMEYVYSQQTQKCEGKQINQSPRTLGRKYKNRLRRLFNQQRS